MSTTMVQIRNVPADFHRRLKVRAAMEGMSMSDYILSEVGKHSSVRLAKMFSSGFGRDPFDTSGEVPRL